MAAWTWAFSPHSAARSPGTPRPIPPPRASSPGTGPVCPTSGTSPLPTGPSSPRCASSPPVSPVKDVSVAGPRTGLNPDTRSGLWLHVTRAVEALRPCLVVIENVRGLLTSPAAARGDVEPCPWCLGDAPDRPALRALGAVLGSLADLGYDARWLVLRASDVGAPHRRERVFLSAWPAERLAQNPDEQPGDERRQSAPDETETGWARPQSGRRGGVAPAHPESLRRHQGLAEPASRQRGFDPAQRGSLPAALASHEHQFQLGASTGLFSGDVPAVVAADVLGSEEDGTRWGRYAAAVARWEILTRPAPEPTDAAGRLRAEFVEWMQGLEPGWVTATPGLGRPAQLTALGNGVVPQQAAHALHLLNPSHVRCPRGSAQ
ncbi:DNA cytosine methyltransferase [Streptomyces sp. SID11385]|nr:DNA cytosine methyltransferase [Streptomyces sp. SID11385]